MKRTLGIWCGALALALLLGGCVQTAPQQEQKAAPAAAAAVTEPAAAEPEAPEYALHAVYMSAPRGFFGPDQPLRRAEAAQLVCNLAGLTVQSQTECGYTDVPPEAWYSGAVCAAAPYFEELDAEASDAPQEAEPALPCFRPLDTALAGELQPALTRALDLPEPALPAGMNGSTALTRADAAVLVNRLLGRTPDRRALETLSYDPLLDMPRTDARYEDVLEAVLSVSCEHYGSIPTLAAQTCDPAEAVTGLKRGAAEQVRDDFLCRA